jgi:uncharacterized membrane protein YkvA (DUF1232 family)
MGLTNWAKRTSHRLRRDVLMLWIAARDPRTPLPAKLIGGLVASYALSPIDLIPDFVPILGMLDDVIIIPIGIAAAFRLIPQPLLDEFRAAADIETERPVSRAGALIVIGIWVLVIGFVAFQLWALRYW